MDESQTDGSQEVNLKQDWFLRYFWVVFILGASLIGMIEFLIEDLFKIKAAQYFVPLILAIYITLMIGIKQARMKK